MRRLLALAVLAALTACAEPEDLGPALHTTPPAALPQRFYPPEGWTWGLIQVGEHPPHRYGVAGPRGESRGDILVVPDAGEPAEVWFETAREMIDAGWKVWIFDPSGQGGSARSAHPREMRHVDDMVLDAMAFQHLLHTINANSTGRLVLFGQGVGALHVVTGSAYDVPTDAIILSGPFDRANVTLAGTSESWRSATGEILQRIGIGAHFALGERGWTSNQSDQPSASDSNRSAVPAEWMRANPMLRSGGPSWSWIAEEADYRAATSSPRYQRRIVVLNSGHSVDDQPDWATYLCNQAADCTLVSLPRSRSSPHLEADAVRDRWLAAVLAAAEGRPLPPPAPAR